jgi:hypothetical protein
MSHGGRFLGALAAAALMVGSLAGCSYIPKHAGSQYAANVDGGADGCMVGHWRQINGWQRLEGDNLLQELRLISGGWDEVFKADGTGVLTYPPSGGLWKNDDFTTKVTVTYSGTQTVHYTPYRDGRLTIVSDGTALTTLVDVNGKSNPPTTGGKDITRQWHYTCSPTELTMKADNVWILMQRQV